MKSHQRNDHLKAFWFYLQLLGVKVLTKSGNMPVGMKIYRLIMIVTMLSSLIINFIAGELWSKSFNVYKAAVCIQSTAIVLMYFEILRLNSKLSIVRKLINIFPSRRNSNRFLIFMMILINVSIFTMFFYPTYVYLKDVKKLFTYISVRFNSLNFQIWFSFIHLLAYYLLRFVAPTILTSLVCAVFCQWEEATSRVKNDLQKYKHCFTNSGRMHVAINLLNTCCLLWKGTYIIKKTFSSFLLYMIVKNIVVTFSLSYAIIRTNTFDSGRIRGISFLFAVEVFFFVITVYLASKIPMKMDEVLVVLKEIYQNISFSESNGKLKCMKKQLKLLSNKKAVVLTVGGWVDMRKSLILNTFGNLITYGLIIVQNENTILSKSVK